MKRNHTFYLVLAALGAVLAVASLLLGEAVPKAVGGMLMGAGAGLFAFGFSSWLMKRWAEKDPAQMRQQEIEAGDERNVAIRNRAKAAAGDALQWCVMGLAWLTIGVGAPLWMTLLAVGVFLGYNGLTLALMVKYQREM